jgi:HK97 family phage prohead protease
MERKLQNLAACEFKLDAEAGTFTGYASKFNGIDSYGDTILPGAYAETLKNRQRPIGMYFNHLSARGDMPAKIGVWTGYEEDDYGLKMQGQLTIGHPTANAVLASMKNGTINGLSIGFRIPPGGSEKEGRIRKLKRIDLVEVSIVEEPADSGATIDRTSIKSAVDGFETLADVESYLREACNFSATAAKDFVSKTRIIVRREAEGESVKAAMASVLKSLDSLTIPNLKGLTHDNRNSRT